MNKIFSRLIACLAVAFFFGMWGFPTLSYAQEGNLSVTHAQGVTVISTKPKKVLVFDLASLDTLDRLGVPITGVPTVKMPHYLSKYQKDEYLKIGTLFEPDYEAISTLAPDLIIIAGRSAAKYTELAKLAPTIDLSVDPKNFIVSALNNAQTLGRIFDRQKEAAALGEKLLSSIAALKSKAAGKGTGLLILTSGGRVSAYGPGSRFGLLYDAFGIAPAAPDLSIGTHGQPISFEFILERNPDWLFVIDRDAAMDRGSSPAKQLLDNELVVETKAWKNKQVVYLDPVNWYVVGAGVSAMEESIDQLSIALDATTH